MGEKKLENNIPKSNARSSHTHPQPHPAANVGSRRGDLPPPEGGSPAPARGGEQGEDASSRERTDGGAEEAAALPVPLPPGAAAGVLVQVSPAVELRGDGGGLQRQIRQPDGRI
jgi:hypothetical protein